MDINKLSPGENLPEELNVVIEIPANSVPVKYEIDEDTNFICVDRFINVPMYYPTNYGFIPQTLSEDGDPPCLSHYTYTRISRVRFSLSPARCPRHERRIGTRSQASSSTS